MTMQEKVKFSIFILSYNRHDLVVHTINSILGQTYPDFEILLADNGSTPSLDRVVEQISDPRIHFFRYTKNMHGCDVGEEILMRVTGSHFLFLADDDVLTPSALSIVAALFRSNPYMELLSTGLVHFDHVNSRHQVDLDRFYQFTGNLESLDGEQTALAFCNGWGIGPTRNFPLPKMGHSSGTFLAMELIEKTQVSQRQLFIKPFGDIGYVGCCANSERVHYIDLPLVVIGAANVREMRGVRDRHIWLNEVQYLKHTPLRAPSHINLGVDAHLKVLHRNGLFEKYNCKLTFDFYWRHMQAVLLDSPWTLSTLCDAMECMPYLLLSVFQLSFLINIISMLKRFLLLPLLWFRHLVGQIRGKQHSQILPASSEVVAPACPNINEFAKWVDEQFVRPHIK